MTFENQVRSVHEKDKIQLSNFVNYCVKNKLVTLLLECCDIINVDNLDCLQLLIYKYY